MRTSVKRVRGGILRVTAAVLIAGSFIPSRGCGAGIAPYFGLYRL
jgi:hypothetical protein